MHNKVLKMFSSSTLKENIVLQSSRGSHWRTNLIKDLDLL